MAKDLKQTSFQVMGKVKQFFQQLLSIASKQDFFVKLCDKTKLPPNIVLILLSIAALSIVSLLLGALTSPDVEINDASSQHSQATTSVKPVQTNTIETSTEKPTTLKVAQTTTAVKEVSSDTAKVAVEEAPVQVVQVSDKAFLKKVQDDQNSFIKEGRIEVWDNSTGNINRHPGEPAYLSFSNDYENTKDNQTVFSGKEFIYAHLHLTKNLTDMLPDVSAKGLQYYRVTLKASIQNNSKYANQRTQENSNKIQRTVDFALGHDTDTLTLAIVPEKGFFESILNKYRDEGKFDDRKTEEEALSDLLARNFSRQLSLLFKQQQIGEHQVNVEFSVTAKLSQEKFVELKNMKGTFLLSIDEEAKERYNNTFDMLTKLYREYDGQHTIAELTIDQDKENEMIANMSPREKERYNIAKNSPLGYMAAYNGEKSDITFRFSQLRDKHAYIDVVWPNGSCEKCEEGATGGLMVSKREAKTFKVPVGAMVSLNGQTLIKKVTGKESVVLYWYY